MLQDLGNLSRRSFLQAVAAASCSSTTAQERGRGENNEREAVLQFSEAPRVVGKTRRVFAFSSDGQLLVLQHTTFHAVGRPTYHLAILNVETGKELKRLSIQEDTTVELQSVAFTPDGKSVVAGGGDRTLKVWDVEQAKQIETIHGFQTDLRLRFSHSGKTLAVANAGQVELWDWETRRRRVQFGNDFRIVRSLCFASGDESMVASGSEGLVIVFDVNHEQIRAVLQQSTGQSTVCAISPDGAQVATGDRRRNALLWDVKGGNADIRLEGLKVSPRDIDFHPDGKILAVHSEAFGIGLFDARTGLRLATVRDTRPIRNPRESPLIVAVRFPDSKAVSGLNADGEVLFWELPKEISRRG